MSKFGEKGKRRRAAFAAISAGAAALVAVSASQLLAQPGCVATYGYWDGSTTKCTELPGYNCITCPREQ